MFNCEAREKWRKPFLWSLMREMKKRHRAADIRIIEIIESPSLRLNQPEDDTLDMDRPASRMESFLQNIGTAAGLRYKMVLATPVARLTLQYRRTTVHMGDQTDSVSMAGNTLVVAPTTQREDAFRG
jgi:hypothetical protein